MRVKDVVELHDKITDGGVNPENLDDIKSIIELAGYFEKLSEKGKEVVTKRMNEQDFVKVVRMCESAVVVSVLAHDRDVVGGFHLLMAKSEGALDGYTRTVVLAILGVLIDEEVV